jgi:hypothetical protein
MSIEDIMRLLALRHHIVIVDSLNNRLYRGIVEDVPRDLWDLAVAGIAPQHNYMWDYDYLWVEVDQ